MMLSPDTLKIWIMGILLLNCAAFGCSIFKRQRPTLVLMGTDWFANIGIIMAFWWLYNAPPLGTIYHVLLATPLVFFPAVVFFRMHHFDTPIPAVIFSSLIPLIGTLFMQMQLDWRPQPILQSTWFIPHVFVYCVAYGLALAAFINLAIYGLNALLKRDGEIYFRASHILILAAFPFFIFGMCSGMMWGDGAWGSYWGWDPKEIWGLITLLLYAIALHLAPIKAQRAHAVIAQIVAFAAIIMTCFMVAYTILGSGSMHSYN